jgi:hypothetical protein
LEEIVQYRAEKKIIQISSEGINALALRSEEMQRKREDLKGKMSIDDSGQPKSECKYNGPI